LGISSQICKIIPHLIFRGYPTIQTGRARHSSSGLIVICLAHREGKIAFALSPSMPLTRNKIRNSEMRDKIVYDHEELYFSDAKSKSRIFELQNSEDQSWIKLSRIKKLIAIAIEIIEYQD
jgi:hypothetical protein